MTLFIRHYYPPASSNKLRRGGQTTMGSVPVFLFQASRFRKQLLRIAVNGNLFPDSSALVKRYVSETGSKWFSDLFAPTTNNEFFIAGITRVEIVAALTRRTRGNTLSVADANAACQIFRNDLNYDFLIVEITDVLLDNAMRLAEKHSLRGYDAIQLSAGCEVQARAVSSGLSPVTFVCADSELNRAALQEGLLVDNPNLHP